MPHVKKQLGSRPDPYPDIPAAGAAKIDLDKIATASDCLDHGDRANKFKKNMMKGEYAHLPGKLSKNITSVSDRARPMTHGVQHEYGPNAGKVVFPKQPHPLLQERESRRERIYHRREHQVLGKSIDNADELPAFTSHPDFRFGMSSFEDDSVKNIMYPPPQKPGPDDEKFRKQYLISHWSFEPGEHRRHYGDFNVPEHKLLPDSHDNNGLRVKEVLHWKEEQIKETQTKIASKRHTEWRKRRQPELGKAHDPLLETISHLPPDYTFGIKFPSDDYNVGDLLGSGKKVQADAKEQKEKAAVEAEQKRRKEACDTENFSLHGVPKPVVQSGRRALAQARRDAQESEVTAKITSVPFEGHNTDKDKSRVVFGLPTVRHRNPAFKSGFFKKLADNTNYGDELDTKCLLSPTPRNTYGDEMLDQYLQELTVDDKPAAQSMRAYLPPAKVHSVILT
ncbi:hypothetical protein BC830DRAFT_1096087 [Chytriomyces sp. MP71]|nr:hypothetical protein BC830DRAFT_1096087 [Chytriomyces sp. MP71]